MANPKSDSGKPVKSSAISSPATTPQEQAKTLGGMPPDKTEAQIDKVNSPNGKGSAP